MGSEGVELVRRVYLAWESGDVEELLSLVDPQVRWSPVIRFLEGERPRSAVTSFGAGFGTFGLRTAVFGRCPSASRITVLACWCLDGSWEPAGWEKETSTFPWLGSGPSTPEGSWRWRRFERSAGRVKQLSRTAAPAEHEPRCLSPVRCTGIGTAQQLGTRARARSRSRVRWSDPGVLASGAPSVCSVPPIVLSPFWVWIWAATPGPIGN